MIISIVNNDYYPFGMPMPNRNIQDANAYRYAYQGQEKDPETGKEAFQLRLWDSRIGRWLTTDPAGQYHSPYMAMDNNPIISTDPTGGSTDDDYLLKSDGTFVFLRERSGPDRLYVEGMNNYYTINDKNLLPSLEGTQSFGTAIGFSNSGSDIFKVFMAGANFTNVEFQAGSLKSGQYYVGTNRNPEGGLSFSDIGVGESDVISMVHSHPGNLILDQGLSRSGQNYSQWEAEQISMGFRNLVDPITVKGFEMFNAKAASGSDAAVYSHYKRDGFKGNYYVYMPQTSNLWKVTTNKPIYIRNIQYNKNRFFFGSF